MRQDEVAGAVDDAGEAGDAVAAEALEGGGDDGNAAGDGCVEAEVRVVGAGDLGEGCAAVGDELLVGGDDGFAESEGAGDPRLDRVKAADGFDEDVDVGGEDIFDVFGPAGVCGHAGGGWAEAFAGDAERL